MADNPTGARRGRPVTTACPGVGLPPKGIRTPDHSTPRGICPCCRRRYALRVGAKRSGPWVTRRHQGLPKRPDGGCPYRCPPNCDFDCYTPEDQR